MLCKRSLGKGLLFLLMITASTGRPQSQARESGDLSFEDYFIDKALRLELFQCGDSRESVTTLHSIVEEPCWPESPKSLLTPFPYGKFIVKVFDAGSNQLIYSKGFDTLFAEYATTKPAISGTKRVFQTTTRIPTPKAAVKLKLERRNADNSYTSIFNAHLEPTDTRIRRESNGNADKTIEIQMKGSAHDCLDIVFLSEGYLASQEEKFVADVKRMTEYLFSVAPYKTANERINIRGVFRASEESGTDDPNKGIFRNTVLNSSFNTLDIDRYLLLEDNHRMHQMAARVAYDTIVVLVNSRTYGGGSICLDYCVCSTDSPASQLVFVHELGHGLAYLADEYEGNVSYSDMYPEGVEPVEPNITRQLDPNKIKWKAFLSEDVSLPTPLSSQTESERIVGAFQGGGYLSKGMYRAQANCWMGSTSSKEGFCVACDKAIKRMIDFYSPVDPPQQD